MSNADSISCSLPRPFTPVAPEPLTSSAPPRGDPRAPAPSLDLEWHAQTPPVCTTEGPTSRAPVSPKPASASAPKPASASAPKPAPAAVASASTPPSEPPSVAFARRSRSDAALEARSKELREKISREPSSVSPGERRELGLIEAEMNRRAKLAAPPTPPDAPRAGVQLCRRPADLPLNDRVGLEHHWLKTSTLEAGMGPAGGGVPGAKDGPSGYPLMQTEITDHTGQARGDDARCDDLPGVDAACVNEKLRIGRQTGRWAPPFNDCQTTTAGIIDDCKEPGRDPWSEKLNRDADAGVP